ncbi:hypothetical protein [Nocardia miyunensis]|uniref:hypothetical protein n=1 Tax=Nocardia miyunensis TaxID=282684 RepID=UPI000A594F10|nr:hypothetical protein [Nocardia miyunensis]
MPPLFTPEALDGNGYPAWVSALADQDEGIILYVARGLDPAAALERLGYPAAATRAVELSSVTPQAPYSSRVEQALGVSDPEEVAAVSARVGEWTLVYEIHGVQQDEAALCVGGMPAACCTVNIESDTYLGYAVDGETVFWVTDPLTVHDLADLPAGLREAAVAAGVYDRGEQGNSGGPAQNFLTVCSLAGLWRLTLADLCGRPLLGSSMEQPILPAQYQH